MSSITIESTTTRPCNTLLCFRLCNSALGTPFGLVVMKMPVPSTRGVSDIAIESTNAFIGMAPSLTLRRTISRPRRQVLMMVNIATPITSGNQPPSAILVIVAVRNIKSLARMPAISAPANRRFHFQM